MRPVALLTAFVIAGCLSTRDTSAQDVTPVVGPEPGPECSVAPRPEADFRALLATPALATPAPTADYAATATAFVPPSGAPASPEVVASLTQTASQLVACRNAGDPARCYALFTDAAIRRLVAEGLPAARILRSLAFEPQDIQPRFVQTFVEVEQALVLDDGRLGAYIIVADAAGATGGYWAAFVEEDGRYRIDEIVIGVGVPVGTPTP